MWKLVLAVALLCLAADAQIKCKDGGGNDVDWYILYKLPSGVQYFYMDSDANKDGMMRDISHQAGPLANTLEPYFNKKTPGYIAYNDQPPTGHAQSDCGHSKGFVMTEENKSGFWLFHSTPKFPSSRERNKFYPSSGKTNAQTFICVTFKYDTFKVIGQHLQNIKAHVFDHNIPNTFHKELQDAANGDTDVSKQPDVLPQDLESEGRQPFRSFAKKQINLSTKTGSKRPHDQNNPCGKDEEYLKNAKAGDLYVFIADNIKSDVQVQHWGSQRGRCGDYKPNTGNKVFNVECIQTDNSPDPWKPSNDHSKWSVSKDDKGPQWTCFGDSNRSLSQFERPGGALCINSERVTQKFKKFIKPKSDCPDKKKAAKKPRTK